MKAKIFSSKISGKITSPTSKSYLQRALAAALLSEGESKIVFNNFCDDTFAALSIIKTLGADVKGIDNGLAIKGGINPKGPVLDCYESGLCMRLFSPIASLTGDEFTLIGTGSLLKRPQKLVEDALTKFDVNVITVDSFPPLRIRGPLNASHVRIDGSLSSQLVSGLLMALPLLEEDSEIGIDNMVSYRYVDMTINLLKDFGIEILKFDNNVFRIKGKQKYIGTEYVVEGDWSGSSFLIVAGLILGKIKIQGLNENSLQADIAIMELLSELNYSFSFLNDELIIDQNQLKEFSFDATDCPDLFPPLFALAANSPGVSKIKGVHRLKHKESDRAKVLIEEFHKLGISSFIEDDTLHIVGGEIISSTVSSHNDHRIAMALSVAALSSKNPVVIEDIQCINKSYPGFYDDLKDLNGNVSIEE